MKKLTLYIHKKCSTCQKALKFIEKKNSSLKIVIKDITETPPSLKELNQMLKFQDGNLKKLFNTSGMQYREMQLSQKLQTMTTEEALKLLSDHGMLVKRPFIIGDDIGLTGFNESLWDNAL
ncbi:MAG: Spx/MgsR family RNA polymerase-binding regulatory protein [Chlamydiota bacterium]|nr:Spx/MgsR family RNA polymerase-binding regulatory protein [Chlamydiota bacterium]